MASMLAHRSAVLGPVAVSARLAPAARCAPLRARLRGDTGGGILRVQRLQAVWAPQQMRRRSRYSSAIAAGPQLLFETAFVVPALVSTLFRAATAGFGIYCLLQWSTFRNVRKDVEHIQADEKVRSADRAKRLKRLQPKSPPNASDDED